MGPTQVGSSSINISLSRKVLKVQNTDTYTITMIINIIKRFIGLDYALEDGSTWVGSKPNAYNRLGWKCLAVKTH